MRKLINVKCDKVLKSIEGAISPVKIFSDMVNAGSMQKKEEIENKTVVKSSTEIKLKLSRTQSRKM